MNVAFALSVLALWVSGAEARRAAPPLNDPVLLNIGFVCKWQIPCIEKQQRAMSQSVSYLWSRATPASKIQLCNRNSSRSGTRKDWIGFNNCIRNRAIGPARSTKSR
jgi:hypothetical protein